MQKVLRYLELNVEWFALGIALLFLGFTVYAYLITQPVTETLNGEPVTPGDVDMTIDQGSANTIRQKMSEAEGQPVPNFPVADFASAVTRGLKMEAEKPAELAQIFDWQPFDLGSAATDGGSALAKVKQLPVLPAAQPLLVAAGLDTLPLPDQNGAAAPAVQPGMPQAAPAPGTPGKDVKLIVAAFTIPWVQIYAQWNKSFGPENPGGQPILIPPAEFQILQVTAYRLEQQADGTWGPPQEVKQLESTLPAYPAAGNQLAESQYLNSIAIDPRAVVAPRIPTPIAGAVWKDPMDPVELMMDQAAAPAAGGDMGEQPSSAAPARGTGIFVETANRGRGGGAASGPPPVSIPPGYGTGGGTTPRPPSAAVQPPEPVITKPAPAAPGTATPIVVTANPGVVPNPAPISAEGKVKVVGMSANQADLWVYVVDETAESGKTYKYRIQYKVLNPLWDKPPEQALNKSWVNQFDLQSPMSGDSPSITAPQQTYVFCAKQTTVKRHSYPFEVITWGQGQWHSATFTVSEGDPIGGMDGGINYATDYSLADVRTTDKGKFITLVDDNGNVSVRNAGTDLTSEDHKTKLEWVNGIVQQPTAPQTPPPNRYRPGGNYGGGAPGGNNDTARPAPPPE